MPLYLQLLAFVDQLATRIRREDRGDVPGWVLVALMSAGLVILLWTLAGPLLAEVFQDAIDRVTGQF